MPNRIRRAATVFGLALGFAWIITVQAQETGRITRVVLYPGSATIERAAHVSAGQTRLELTGLAANFDIRTLRVDADPGIRIGEIAVRDVARTEAASAREGALEARIQALKDEKAVLDVEVKSAELVRDFLVSLNSKPDKTRPVAIDAKTIPTVIDAIRRGGSDAYASIQRVEVKKRALDKQIAALERDLARLKSGARDSRTLAISLSAARPGEVRASYQVANAGWRPGYRASLDSTGSRVELERVAAVTQRTGEDWSAVMLRLSTGQPRAAAIVDPAIWQLVIRSPAELRDQVSSMAAAPAKSGLLSESRRQRRSASNDHRVPDRVRHRVRGPGEG